MLKAYKASLGRSSSCSALVAFCSAPEFRHAVCAPLNKVMQTYGRSAAAADRQDVI